ncbi:hypothetical protein HC891_06565 [Candidatus Gracilibacteria bacterium]|nr:hypothetical protein [Candidatus Gracilibacteria bacterium]
MDQYELLAALEEGLVNGRISPQTAAYIAAELLGVDAYETGYQEWDGIIAQHNHQPALLAVNAD